MLQQISFLSRRLASTSLSLPGERCLGGLLKLMSNQIQQENKTLASQRHYSDGAQKQQQTSNLLGSSLLTEITPSTNFYCLTKNNNRQSNLVIKTTTSPLINNLCRRQFHAPGSKINYLDFRFRPKTNTLKLHLLIIRRAKMKKHKLRKFRKKYKCLLAKQRLKREIAKEKAFRVELLTMIRRAEMFDPREFALRKIAEVHNKPEELSKEERLEQLKELIRIHRYQVTYIKPKHRRSEI